jgi:hypothetical protein
MLMTSSTMNWERSQLVQAVHLAELLIERAFVCRRLEVEPPVPVLQFPAVDLQLVVEPVGPLEVEVLEKQGELLFVLHVDGFFPVERVLDPEVLADFHGHTDFGVLERLIFFGEGFAEERVLDILHELTVLVVRDFVDVHVKRRNGHRLRFRVQRERNVLVAGTHRERTLVDVVHPVGVHLDPLFTRVNADQFPLRAAVAPCQQGCRRQTNQKMFHGTCG